MPGELDGPRSFTAGPIWALIQVSDPPRGFCRYSCSFKEA